MSNLSILPAWELQWMSPDFLGKVLEHCLKHIGRAITAFTESLYFNGNPAPLSVGHPTWAVNLLFPLMDQLQGLTPELGISFHLPGDISTLGTIMWKTVRMALGFLQVNPNVFPTILTP